jgi:hypothetical protein
LNDNKEFTLNEKAIAQDATRDGYFGVVTNVMDMGAKEIIENYKTLWIVEDAFGEVKGTLRARPIFHWTDPLTLVEAMRERQEVRAVPVKVSSTTLRVRTDIHGNAHRLFSAIGLKPPPKVLRLSKSANVVATSINWGSCTPWANDQPSSKIFKALVYLDRSHSFLAMCIFSRACWPFTSHFSARSRADSRIERTFVVLCLAVDILEYLMAVSLKRRSSSARFREDRSSRTLL